jgi:hypothetical protein
MSIAPIGHDLEKEFLGTERDGYTADQASLYPQGYPEVIQAQTSPRTLSPSDFVTNIVDAQQRLITAQHQVLHDGDLHKLARAQLDVITIQNSVLDQLGVFGNG